MGATIRRVTSLTPDETTRLAEVLIDCVEGGASVSFMLPLGLERACAYWASVAQDLDGRVLLVAEDDLGIVGTVQLVPARPENQPHRADVTKLLVHRRGRRQGVGEALMRAVEEAALDIGRSVLVLDTADDAAARLYSRLGWQRVGVIPDFALMPDGGLCDTTVFHLRLSPRRPEPRIPR